MTMSHQAFRPLSKSANEDLPGSNHHDDLVLLGSSWYRVGVEFVDVVSFIVSYRSREVMIPETGEDKRQ